jgi:uncharacterized protein (PEP-CTERM system associated)
MVKGPAYGQPRRLPVRLAPLAAAAMLLAAPPSHADWRVVPTFSLTETWTDNVALQRSELAESQWITEFMPGIALVGSGQRFKVAASSQWRHFEYSGTQQPGTVDSVYEYSFSGQGELAKDLLFIEAQASASPQAISAFGPQLSNSLYAMGNRTQIKTWRVSPHLEQRLGRAAHLSLRYTRDSVDAGDFDRFGTSTGDSFNATLNSGPGYRSLDWGLSFMRQNVDNELAGPSSNTNILSNLRYRITPRFGLTATAGYDRYDYQSLGGRTAGRSWSTGFDWQPSTRTSLKASAGRHYFGKTGALDATHRSRHTTWNINYDDSVTNTRSQFLLPSAIDTAAMLDGLFKASIPDPVLRQQAVADYIRNAGLPPSLADSVNFLSNRYVRQKRLQATSAFKRGHSTAALSLYRTERIALSSRQSDSALLGSQLLTLNDDVHQLGANLIYGYRINARSLVSATVLVTRNRSLSTGFEDNNRQFRLGLNRDISKHIRAAFEVRHQRGSAGINAGSYRENAVSASLAAQL